MPAPDLDLRPGDVLLGKYRVEDVLGRGGMGVVVAARHLSLDDRVAIKFLLPERLGDAESVERFLREARAAVRIRSQHIARVSDVGTMENGAPYIVMEYLEGKNLSAVVAQERLPIPLALDLVLQAGEALAEAHASEIVHRDVKPSNLFLARHADGSPCMKVLDFGISKMPGAQDHALTRTGVVFGSPLYMSPEQLRSARDVDARTDVYSLGVVLYELLTGRVPYNGGDLPQLVYNIMHEATVPPRSLRPEVPEGLERAIARAMERDRNARFQSIAEFARAIEPFASPRAKESVERICGVLRAPRGPLFTERPGAESSGAAAAVTQAMEGQDATALLAPQVPLKGEAPSSLGSFGATMKPPAPPRSALSRVKAAPIALGVVIAAAGIGLWAARSSRSSEPPAPAAVISEPVAEPPPDSVPAKAPPAASIPSSAPSPTSSVPATVASAPPSAHPPVRPPPPAAGTPPKHPRKDPFRRDVF
ncbi:MAG TPA: protein kinase [Polyangiaceae bacterium]